MAQYVLKLFINSLRQPALSTSIKHACEQLTDEFELAIIDVWEQPHLGEAESILATPTLIRYYPPPILRFVGTFQDSDRLIRWIKTGQIY